MLTTIKHHFYEFGEYRRMFGLRDALGTAAYHLCSGLFPGAYRRQSIVFLHALMNQANGVAYDEATLLHNIGVDDDSRKLFCEEYEALRHELQRRVEATKGVYPDFFAVEGRSACVIYALTRFFRPQTVLETGVANGHSSYFILHAIERNGTGQLHSIDIANDVGSLLSAEERQRWKLHIVDVHRPEQSLREIVQSVPTIDLFLHDADHSYRGVWRELVTVWSRLSPNALVAADDCDYSWAFADFCREHKLSFQLMFDKRKLFGVSRLGCAQTCPGETATDGRH